MSRSPKKDRRWGAYGSKPKPGPKPWHVQKEGPNKGKLFVPMPKVKGGGAWMFPDEALQFSEGGDLPQQPPKDLPVGKKELNSYPEAKTRDEKKYPYLRKGD
jgi:hypothetical protein